MAEKDQQAQQATTPAQPKAEAKAQADAPKKNGGSGWKILSGCLILFAALLCGALALGALLWSPIRGSLPYQLSIAPTTPQAAGQPGVVVAPQNPVVAGQNADTGTPQLGSGTTLTTTVPAGWPTTREEFLSWVTQGQPAPEGWMPIEVGEIHTCPGETYCWSVTREKDLNAYIVPFWVRNPTSCLQDGWMAEKSARDQLGRRSPATALGSGIPTGWQGLAQGATFRPCPR